MNVNAHDDQTGFNYLIASNTFGSLFTSTTNNVCIIYDVHWGEGVQVVYMLSDDCFLINAS